MRNAKHNAAEILERHPREPPTISHRLPVQPANAPDPCAATQWIQNRHRSFRPRIGIVLGSGLGDLAQAIEEPTQIAYRDIPDFPEPKVPGHSGQLVLGHLEGAQVAVLQGRCHLYEGWSLEESLRPLRTVLELGIELLILSNASGGINPRFHSGQVVAIDSHINWLFQSTKSPNRHDTAGYILMRNKRTYDAQWLTKARETAEELGFSLPSATYLATLGPNYETRAEYRAFGRLGADIVGMSTVPESILAMQLGTPVLAFSVVTNVANPDIPTATQHNEVLAWSSLARSRLEPLVSRIASKYFSTPNRNH